MTKNKKKATEPSIRSLAAINSLKEKGEQLNLIDVLPEKAKPIIAVARRYKKIVTARVDLTAQEVKLKAKIIGLVKAAKITPLEGGVIKFTHKGITVTIKPRDELVQVKDETKL